MASADWAENETTLSGLCLDFQGLSAWSVVGAMEVGVQSAEGKGKGED